MGIQNKIERKNKKIWRNYSRSLIKLIIHYQKYL